MPECHTQDQDDKDTNTQSNNKVHSVSDRPEREHVDDFVGLNEILGVEYDGSNVGDPRSLSHVRFWHNHESNMPFTAIIYSSMLPLVIPLCE